MNFNRMNLKSKMLFTFISTVIVLMIGTMLVSNRMTKKALTQNLESSLTVMSNIAARAITPGLEFSDNDAIRSAINEFTQQDLFSYISIKDASGKEVLHYRKNGMKDIRISNTNDFSKYKNEMFQQLPVTSSGNQIGLLTLGISLEERNNHLSNAFWTMIIAVLIMTAFFTFITIFIARNISDPIGKLTKIAWKMSAGDLRQKIDIQRGDEIGKLAESFRKMVATLEEKAMVAGKIAEGDLDVKVEKASEADVLGESMMAMKQNLTEVMNGIMEMNELQKSGDMDAKIPAEKLKGIYRKVAEGVNESVKIHVDNTLSILEVLSAYAKGDFSKDLKLLPGKQAVINENMNELKDNLQNLVDEMLGLTQAAAEGDLSSRGDADKFNGAYRQIMAGVNNTLDAIVKPVNEVLEVLDEMAKGILTRKMQGEYKGDYAQMRNSLNSTIDALNDILAQVNLSVDQVTDGVRQVSDASQAVSQGATEQAGSLEEITSSMAEIGSQSRQNAENAAQANQLSTTARNSAETGNNQMKQMLQAMEGINESSGQISKIIKVIDEIAFQTNLLALNAAVEAARAGIHGKGFAVVAEEVRNLAQRSAKAARETTELIEGSLDRVENGTKIANQTAHALDEIIQVVTKVTDLVGEIANASKEQVQGLDQVNHALVQVDQVTQSNAASAEESASAAEELSGQSHRLKTMLGKFHLAKKLLMDMHRNQSPFQPAQVSRKSPAPEAKKNGRNGGNGKKKNSDRITPNQIIALDDDDFGEF